MMNQNEEGLPPVFDPTPLNCVPFNSTPMPFSSVPSLPSEVKAEPLETIGPDMLYLTYHPTTEEPNNFVASSENGITLSGCAAGRQAGPLGLVDIGVCEDAYLFRVSLPGVSKEEKDFDCIVDKSGHILILGVTTTCEKVVCKNLQRFQMQNQNHCSSEHFSISFQLPGPVQPLEFVGNFGNDGILEGVVMKEGMGKL